MQIGIDYGGTKIEAAALDAKGAFLARIRRPNPGEYASAIETVRELIAEIETQTGQTGTIGIGMPGSISPTTGVMRNANSVYLNGRPFREDLQKALSRPIRMANDANCLALSEAVDGAAAGTAVAFAVIVGTGCGGGLVANGALVDGAGGIAGEWGHTPLPWPTEDEYPGPQCWCGHKGCLETWISGTGFRADFRRRTGRDLTGEEIVAAMHNGDGAAKAVFEAYADRLGRGLAVICNLIDPDVIVLGGGMSNVAELYARVPSVIAAHIFSDGWAGKLVKAKWGDSSGVRGAARLWGETI